MIHSVAVFKSLRKTIHIQDALKYSKSQIITNQYTQTIELRRILDATAKELNITHLNDWYKMPLKDYPRLYQGLDQSFKNEFASPFQLLSSAYPEHDWMPWKFEQCPKHYWNDMKNVKKYMQWAAQELHVKQLSDWYNVSSTELRKIRGATLLQTKPSYADLLMEVYPEYDWLPWKFEQCPKGYWGDIKNVKKFMEWAARELNVKEMSDWYNISFTDLKKIGGSHLLQLKPSYAELLMEVYPDFDWLPWKFEQCPRNFWSDKKNVRKFMEWAAQELNVKEMSDWYSISSADIKKIGGIYLLQAKTSYIELLAEMYPDYDWLPWKFEQCPKGYWDDVKNVRKFTDWAAQELNVKEMSDWYNISYMDLSRLGGTNLLALKSTVIDLLLEAYPEYNWELRQFSSFSTKSMITNQNRKVQYVKWMASQLNIKEMSDWYRIKAEQIIDLRGGILLVESHSLSKLLSLIFPEYKWEESRFEQKTDIWTDSNLSNYFVEWLKTQNDREITMICKFTKEKATNENSLLRALNIAFPNKMAKNGSSLNSKKSQYMLKECIETLFNSGSDKNTLIMEEYKHPDVENLELDYFLPEHKIAFEYQGKQHYRTGFHHRQESIETTRGRDRNKQDSCKDLGITLIEVPYWWDRKSESLAVTIYNSRPDLFLGKPEGNAIPTSLPLLETNTNMPKHVAMTATIWDNETMEPTGWFMTEKYDGIRFLWDGENCFSRQGNKINIPLSLSSQLPRVALDGELWTQYGLHQEAVHLMNTNKEEKWNKAIFWIFDAPKLNKPLEERIEFLQQLNLPSFAKVVEFVKCEGKEHLKQFTDVIIAKRGEGVVLREPGSMYKSERSSSLRKYKPYFDTEVRVVKNQYPQGFTCEQLNGKTVFVNTKNSEEAKSIRKGSVITVKHSGMNVHGTLLYPQFFRKRLDVTWNDLVNKVV